MVSENAVITVKTPGPVVTSLSAYTLPTGSFTLSVYGTGFSARRAGLDDRENFVHHLRCLANAVELHRRDEFAGIASCRRHQPRLDALELPDAGFHLQCAGLGDHSAVAGLRGAGRDAAVHRDALRRAAKRGLGLNHAGRRNHHVRRPLHPGRAVIRITPRLRPSRLRSAPIPLPPRPSPS